MQQLEERIQKSVVSSQNADLRNILFRKSAICDPQSGIAEQKFRQVNRSPNDEFAARVQAHGSPKKFPQSVIALILQKQKHITVTKTGINFDYQGNKYQFWSATSLVCANQVDQRVLVTFDPDDMAFCHVLTDDGRVVESIPQKNKVAWFDDEAMRAAMRDKAHALNRDLARYRDIHQATSEQKAQKVLSNAEKMQIVNTFTPEPKTQNAESETLSRDTLHNNPRFISPGDTSMGRRLSTSSRAPSLSRRHVPDGFDKADRIQDAVEEIRRQRVSKQDREEKIESTRFSEAEMAAVKGTDRIDDYKISAEEIAGVLKD